jgi:hypothetical protein
MKVVDVALRLLFVLVLGAARLGARVAAHEQAAAVADTVHKLAAVRPADVELPYDVPQAAQPLLTQLKHGLRDLILDTISDRASGGVNTTQLTRSVLQKLKSVGVEVGGEDQPEYFGGISGLEIVQPSGHPELRAATTTLNIPCGDDTSLYVLKQVGPRWTVILAVESNDYARVNGAQGDFGYGISAPDESGNWYLVTKYVPPWCTSRWAGIRYQVLRPGSSPAEPMVLLKREHSHVRDERDWLAVGKRGFTLVNVGSQSLDGAILERIHVQRYSVTDNRITRVPPIAVIPQDFVDEWVELPLEEARRWSNASAIDRIESWHSRLQQGTGNDFYFSEFEFVQPCNEPPSKWQIGIRIDSKERQDKLPPELFFTVSNKDRAFYMMDISEKRAPGCPGEAYPVNSLDWGLLEKALNQ